MSLIITFMFEPAKLQMNCASASGSRMRRRSAGDRVAFTSSGMRPRRAGLSGCLLEGHQAQRSIDESKVRKGLREVAQVLARGDVDLLRVQKQRPRKGQQLFE